MPVDQTSWKAVVQGLTGPPPVVRPTGNAPVRRRAVPGRGNPRAQAQRPVIKPTPGAPRKTSDWNIALSELGLGGGNKVGGAVKAASLPDFMGAWKPVAAKPKQDEGHSVLGFLGNIAGEVKDTALGLVETGYQGIKSTGQGLYGGTIGWIPGTGGDTAREAFVNNFNNNLDAVWSTLKQSGSNWKSVVTGDFEPLYKHPLSMALDVASIASGGAGAVAKGAQVARAAEVARAAKILDSADLVEAARGIKLGNGAKKGKAIKRESPYPVGKGQSATGKFKPGEARNAPARPAWLQGALDQIPGGAEKGAQLAKSNARVAKLSKIADSRSLAARVRPNRVLKTTPIELEKLQSLELDTAKLSDSLTVPSHGAGSASLPRRPLARGPVGRQIQKGGIKAYELLLDKSPRLNSLSERNFSRRLVEHGDRIAKERAAQVQVNAGRLQFDEAVRKLGRDPMLKAAATLHLEGVLTERGGLTASELRDRAVARAEEGLAAERRAHPNADPKSYEQNVRHIELLKSMPDELLKLEGDSKHVARVRQVVDTGRNFDRNMSKHDPFRLDESGVRDVRGERATISQRVLTGNAEKIDLGESRSRVMVRSQWERMRRSGKVFASDRAIGKTFRDAATRAGLDNAPGVAARDWIVNETHVLRDHKGEITPEQEIHLLEGVERGEIRDKRGRTALPGVRADAGHAIKRIKQQERNSQPLVTAYRVRGADGGATHWVREERKGEVPAAIREHGTRRKGGDVVEKVVVPANHWRARQDENGRVASLGKSLETGTVRLKDGTLVGQRGRTATVRPGARVDAARYELSAARKSEFLPRDEGYKPGGFADSVNRGTLTPGQEQQLRQQLGVNKPRNKMTNEEIVIKNLIDAGHLNIRELSASGKKLTEADVEKAIGKYTSDMFDGKLPLNADGQVNFDAMFKRLRSDKKLAEAYNDPRLLSEVETAPGVYMSHQAVGTIGGHGRASRGRQVTSTVGPEMGVRKNDGVLAGRMGYSLDPVVMMHDANNISKIIASRDFLMHAVQAWAVSDKNGRPIVMPAKDAMRLDDAQYRAVPLSQIKNAETTIREWRPGKKKEDDLPLTFVDDGGVDGAEKVVVFPRDIADKLQYAFGNPHGFWKKYDSVMQIWRSGVLALTPRWYINNLVGNTFFYGVYTGMDLTSLRIARAAAKQAKASGKGSVIPHQVHGEGMSSQGQDTVIAGLDAGASATGAGKGRFSAGYYRVTDRGYQINNVFEGAVRDAAYVHAFKKFLKDNGQSVKRRGLSRRENDAEMLEALANAPDHIKQHVIRETERWMGDYRGLNRFERDVLRRAIPFYSWVRVINTWLFGMPFRSPLRARALVLAGQIGRELQGDRSYLPWWEQGRIEDFLGFNGWALRTQGLNPMSSVMEELVPFGMKGASPTDIGQELLASFGGQSSPAIQAIVGMMTGRKMFGDRAYTAPAGYGGTVQAFGKEPQYINTVTGQVETRSNRGQALIEGALQMVPFATQARDLLSWGKTPYDSSSTLELALDRLTGSGSPDLYQPPKQSSGREKIPGLSPLLGLAGLPGSMYDKNVERESDRGKRFKYTQAEMQQRRLAARQALKRSGQGG